jgi:hypothetical protein
MWVKLNVTCALLGLGTGEVETHYTFIYAHLLKFYLTATPVGSKLATNFTLYSASNTSFL